MDGVKRNSAELRRALAERRSRIAADLDTLGSRLEESLSVRGLVGRHPVLTVTAGALLGVLLYRRPTWLLRAAGRLAGWGLPLLFAALIRRAAEHPSSSRPAGVAS